MDAVNSLGVLVDFTAELNLETGLATWTLTALDPETLDTPIDPLVGFLPPNQTSPDGEGFVSYSIRSRSGLATGTRLDAQASIVFDFNDAIETPAIYNTIDAGPPMSHVLDLPAEIQGDVFLVEWSGQDDAGGAGISRFDLYVSDDGGPYTLWLADTPDTQGTYTGQFEHTYAFYSVARDHVGHRELPPSTPDTQTTLLGAWHNWLEPLDVNADTFISPIDALLIINYMNSHPVTVRLADSGLVPPPYYDVNNDGWCTPIDALRVINRLNSRPDGEGESAIGQPGRLLTSRSVTDKLWGLRRALFQGSWPQVHWGEEDPTELTDSRAASTDFGPRTGASEAPNPGLIDPASALKNGLRHRATRESPRWDLNDDDFDLQELEDVLSDICLPATSNTSATTGSPLLHVAPESI